MSDDKLLAALGKRAREQREEKIDYEPLDAKADARIAGAILGKPKLKAIEGGKKKSSPVIPFAFAAAAAIALFFLWPRDRDLPKYAFELSGNVAEVRSDGPKIVEQHATLNREASLQIVLRPESPVANIKAAAALVRDGKARAWTPPMEISPDGAVRIVGPARTLLPDVDAPWEILVAIGANVPSDPEALLKLASEPRAGVRVVRAKIDFK